jgi:ADP-ribose pyrophosphatase
MSDPQTEDLHVGKYLSLRATGSYEFVERRNTTGCVVILGRTDADELILVEQYRPPVGRRVIALPAGLAGDLAGAEKENLAEAARREFEEETGYRAAGMQWLMSGPRSSGLTSEIMTFYRADGVEKIADQPPDAAEKITCHAVPLQGLLAWLRAREDEGFLIDYKIYAALYVANLVA